ncbi:ATP-binding protein [Lacicoccus alkaliphilus]|uniref:DNA polymerase-3 subunit delta n=1 Tax=Lacicoccus alkaliphilus DSM 16010 TaxID=1123231 RepID=A0A1M7K0Z6_9BACL|nr:DNA polymerase III subunit [Salinicoccus alkaliphilus]SHM58970.1 DNA polymerase-3 subunit delta' [Salinicoccus alkaliphilus DSM 16010]
MEINHTIEKNLLNAIQNNRLSHTYMFEGDALETLRRYSTFFTLNIFGDTPRNRALMKEGNHPDFYYLGTEETTIKKEEVARLMHVMNNKPTETEYKVYVIEAFDKLTPQAENSLLKFLEEPPEKTIALLLTVDKSNILPTIHSRAQHIFIRGDSSDRLKELEYLSEDDLQTIDALSLNAGHVKDMGEDFSKLRQAALEFSVKWMNRHSLVLLEIKPMLEWCDERRDYLLLLQLIDGCVRQAMHSKLKLDIFKPYNEDLKVDRMISVNQLTKMLDEIEQANKMIQFNVHPMLAFEGLVIISKG